MKVALLAARTLQDRLFVEPAIAELTRFGDIVRNEDDVVDPATVAALGAQADVLVTSWKCPRLDRELVDGFDQLKLVIHAAGSVKRIVSPAVWERGIRVSSGSGPLGRGVAETTLGMTIASLKNLWRLTDSTAAGGWNEERAKVRELYNITIGVIGAGRAGAHYIRLLRGFEVEVLLYDPVMSSSEAIEIGARKVDLDVLLSASDVVSIHAPMISATRHLLDADRLQMLKEGAILINTARGAIIDQDALVHELRSGRIFACLDVTDPEPLPVDHELRVLPNCVLTGHVAGAVTNGLERLGWHAVAELGRYVSGEKMDGEVYESSLATSA